MYWKKTFDLEQGKSTEDMATWGYGYIHVKVWQIWVVIHVKFQNGSNKDLNEGKLPLV